MRTLSDQSRDRQRAEVVTLDWSILEERLEILSFLPMFGHSTHLIKENEETDFYDFVLERAKEIDDLRLIVFDPLRRFHDGEENDSHSATAIINCFERLARETGAACLAIHHMAKGAAKSGGQDQYAARGSTAFTDNCRCQINLYRVDGHVSTENGERREQLEVAVTKNNYGPPQIEPNKLIREEGGYLSHYNPTTIL